MSNVRNNKNIQSAVASAVFVGLRAEHSHVSTLHVTNLFDDNDQNIFKTLEELKQQNAELKQRLDALVTTDLQDVAVENVSNGDVLVYQNGKWQPAELFKEEEEKTVVA